MRSPPWPTATPCGRFLRRCGGCSRSPRSIPSPCAGSSPTRSSGGVDISLICQHSHLLPGRTPLVLYAACTYRAAAARSTMRVNNIAAHRAAVDRFMHENKDIADSSGTAQHLVAAAVLSPIDPVTAFRRSCRCPKIGRCRPCRRQPAPSRAISASAYRVHVSGTEPSLGAFVPEGQPIDQLFVPFTDTTSGAETVHGRAISQSSGPRRRTCTR